MKNKKAITLVILLGLEMVMYSFRFIKLSPESKLLPSDEVLKTLSNRNVYDKLNGSCMSVGNFNINQGIFLDSENINGYNPIFPKRLLRTVNAAEGRDPDWVESVSLNMKDVKGEIFKLAGVNRCDAGQESVEKAGSVANIFSGINIVDDAIFFEDVKKQAKIVSDSKISILYSDSQLAPATLEHGCAGKKNPSVEVIGRSIIKVSSECDFYYVNPYLYYPGWTAIDGKNKSKAFPAFGYLQGYRITAGNKQIEFLYFPSR